MGDDDSSGFCYTEKRKWNRFLKKYPWIKNYYSESSTNVFLVMSAGYTIGVDQKLLMDVYSKITCPVEIFIPKNESFSLMRVDSIETAEQLMEQYRNYYVQLPWRNVEIAFTLRFLNDFNEVKSKLLSLTHINDTSHLPPSCLKLLHSYCEPILKENIIQFCMDVYKSIKLSTTETQNLCISRLASRYAVHYGYKFEYTLNSTIKLPKNQSIPIIFNRLIQKMLIEKIIDKEPNQLTINFYEPGDGIPSHVDVHSCFDSPILCLSLCSGIMMTFKDLKGNSFECWLEENSLLAMEDKIRYEWKHAIIPRSFDMVRLGDGVWKNCPRKFRISLTFRTVKTIPNCDCNCTELCDFKNPSINERDHFKNKNHDFNALDFEKLHVTNFYDTVAEHFSYTRKTLWKKVSYFLNSLEKNSFVCDVGCGNGKYMKKHPNNNNYLTFVGTDSCFNLLHICRQCNLEVFHADALHLPLRDSCVDHTLCIAVMHHLSTYDRRVQLLSELIRITKVGGKILLSVWSSVVDDNRAIKNASPITLFPSVTQNTLQKNDYLVPWTLRNISQNKAECELSKLMRYIHLFTKDDIKSIVNRFQTNILVESLELDQANWFVTIKKL